MLAAEIVTSGTEILLGDIVDTNAAWIAQQLREAGVNLYYKTTVGDNEGRLRGVLELGMGRSDVIIVTGGLGPTVDDITRQAVAGATGRPLILHEGALRTLQERFARFGVEMTANNRQQALIPDGATLIPNPVGTAPGFIVETERCAVIALPGVPREMKHLLTESVLPYLRARMGSAGIIRRRILRTFGIGESIVDDRLIDLMSAANPTVGLAAHTGQVDIRIAARAESAAAAETLLDEVEAIVRARVGQFIYSNVPDEAYETVLARRLRARELTLAVYETNTQGVLAERLARALPDFDPVWLRVDGERNVLAWDEAVAADSDPDQLPAEDLAGLAAARLRLHSGAAVGVALVGSAAADEGVFGQRSGETWLGLATGQAVTTTRIPFGGQDDYTVVRICNQALRKLWELTVSAL